MITAGECRLYTSREGALSAVGHDLVLRATRWAVDLRPAARTVTARVESASVVVLGAWRGDALDAGALTAGDRAKIERAAHDEVLQAGRFPAVVFEGSWAGDDPSAVDGALTLCGVTRPLTVGVTRAAGRVVCAATVHQPTWGIAPYRALLGALRVRSDVRVEWVLEGADGSGQ